MKSNTFSTERETFIDGRNQESGTGWLSLAIDKNRDLVYIVSLSSCQVLVYDLSTGDYLRSVGANPGQVCEDRLARKGELKSPYGIAVDNNGWIYVTESRQPWHLPPRPNFNVGVQAYDENGTFVEQFGITIQDPGHIVAPNNGKIYVVDSANVRDEPGPSRVLVYQPGPQLP